MGSLFQDIRYAVRVMKRSPGFTVIAALTIAVGIAATTTIFSMVNAVLLKPPPGIRDASELVRMHRIEEDGSRSDKFSYPNFLEYRETDAGLTDLVASAFKPVALTSSDQSKKLFMGFLVSQEYFRMIGVRPAFGRLFLPEEDRTPGTHLVAILSHGAWTGYFAGDSSIVGGTIVLNGTPFTVVGVAQEGFRGPIPILDVGVWMPINAAPALDRNIDMESRALTWVDIGGRRAPGVSRDEVAAALNVASENLRAAYPDGNPDYGVVVDAYAPISRRAMGAALAFSALLFVVAGTVLLIACLNVGSMLLARASRRGKEMAMRLALGAGRGRVVRQLITESVVLFTLGAFGGLLLTVYATALLSSFQLPFDIPVIFDFSPDLRVLVFSLAIALATGILFGLAPALHVTRTDLQSTIKEGHGTGMAKRSRLRRGFVVLQVAGSALLLVGAGLFARGLARVHTVDIGFEPDGLHALSIEADLYGYNVQESAELYRSMLERSATVPGVESVALTDFLPVTFGGSPTGYQVEGGEALADADRPSTLLARVTPGYFQTFRIPLLRGRDFEEADREGSRLVAVVNETLAQRSWPGADPMGRRIRLEELDDVELEVVGVARNAKYGSLTEDPRAMVYVPYDQWQAASMVMMARLTREGTGVANAFRAIVVELDATAPIDTNNPYGDLMGIAMLPSRMAAMFAAIFGAVGLLMAALGLYGVLAFTVAQRTREIGIRIALGAQPGQVRSLVLRDGVKLAGLGLAIGLAIALLVSGLLRGLLFGLSPMDPVTFIGIALLLMAVALAASYVPASRATRANPVDSLRVE